MIDYKISWTPGTNAFGWSGAPAITLDPLHRGFAAHQKRDWRTAQAAYLEALRARPNRALAAYNFGLLQIDQGMGLSSIPFLLRASLLEPGSATYQGAMLFAYLRSGDLDGGEALLARCNNMAVPIDAALWTHYFSQAREGVEAAALNIPPPQSLDPLVVREPPDHPLTLNTQSPCHAGLTESFARLQVLYTSQRLPELLEELGPLLDQHSDWGEGHHLRGMALSFLQRWEPAAAALGKASELLLDRPDVWDHLGNALDAKEDFLGARRAYDHSLALNPAWHVSWNNAADAAIGKQRFAPAYQYAHLALTLAPDNETCLFNFARAAQGTGNYNAARQALVALIQRYPDHRGAERQLGYLCLETGAHAEAMRHFDRAIAIDPDNLDTQSSLLFLNTYLGTLSQADIGAQAKRYGEALAAGLKSRHTWSNNQDPGRPLRIGFVSGDLRQHPVGFFFIGVAQALAQSRGVELFAYPTTRASDSLTDTFRGVFDHWVPIPGLDDEEASARVLADGIDILVDLSGHTGKHRLGLFAHKPAPIQVTWLGYSGTTGLTQIDYLLAGPWDVPSSEEAEFSESIWRLPHTRFCFSRPEVVVPVDPLPALSTGYVTFGCFNNLNKLDDRVVALWSQILAALPQVRLFLRAEQLGSEDGRAATAERFRVHGIGSDRLLLEGRSHAVDYLSAYGRVDIALDPFPYTGATTTIESLWMGVPVLTLAGDRMLARQSEGMLRALGMDDWIAASEEDYLARAIRLAKAGETLQGLRSSLRQRVEASPLMNAPQFAADLEAAFRAMWISWCEGGTARREART